MIHWHEGVFVKEMKERGDAARLEWEGMMACRPVEIQHRLKIHKGSDYAGGTGFAILDAFLANCDSAVDMADCR
jgi:hypothetical protein